METSDCIIEGLYLGGVMAALNERDLQAKSITHVLSVDEKPLPDVLTSRLNYRHVFALDLYDFDLLSVFPESISYIDQARESGGRVLVHCQAGISRSSAVVIAYLMYKLNMTKQKAVEYVSSIRHFIKPNDGFQEQLQLFENMGARIDKTHSEFRAYQLNKLAIKFQCGQYSGGVPESEIPSEVYIDPDYSAKGKAAFFKCRKCRLFLFHSGALTSHNIGEGESAFDWRSKIPANQKKREERESQERMQADGAVSTKCVRSLFVDPLAWMKGKIHEIQGKLHCPKCNGKIGSYVWYGEKCPCGAWVAPAFHVDSGKVDKIPSQPVTPSSHTPVPSQVGAAASSPPGGMIPARRPLSYVPLPERSSSAASGRKGDSPVAAVQPRVATVASATVIRGGGTSAQGIFPISSSTAAATPASLSSTPSGFSTVLSHVQRPGVQRVAATVAPLQTMDFDESGEGRMVENVDTSGDNHDIESGINSIHMDVDS